MTKFFFYCVLTGFLTQLGYSEDNLDLHLDISVGSGYVSENIIHDQVASNSKHIADTTHLDSVPSSLKGLNDNEFNGEDMTDDVVGALASSIIASRLNRKITVSIQKKKGNYFVGFEYRD